MTSSCRLVTEARRGQVWKSNFGDLFPQVWTQDLGKDGTVIIFEGNSLQIKSLHLFLFMLEFFFLTFEKEKQTKCQDDFSNLLISTKVLATEHFLYLINQLIYFRYSWTLVLPSGLRRSFVIKDQCRSFHNAQGQEVVTRWPIILITCWRLFCHYRYLLRLLRSSDLRADFTTIWTICLRTSGV